MSFRPDPTAAGPAPTGRQLLFTPGPRLGWVFRDRREIALAYSEPRPNPQAIQAQAAARAAGAEQSWARAWRWAGKPSIALAVILVLLAGCQKSVSGSFSPGLTIITIVVLCGPGLGYAGLCWLRRDQARATTPEREYHQALARWEERAAGHENAELARLAGQPEWGTILIPGYRTDIFGGTLAGWQALLTVHGASILAERPLLTVDLTGQHAAGMLSAAARDAGIQSVTYRLPHELGRCGLLTELTPGQFADAIAESLHAGTPDGARADRAVDVWILQQLTGVLGGGGGATPQRLAAAVRTALGHIAPNGLLSPGEQELIAGDLFPAAYRQQVTANLVRLDAVLGELAAHTGGGWPQKPGRFTCVAMDTVARSVAGEVLTALVIGPMAGEMAVCAPLAGRFIARRGSRLPAVTAGVALAVSSAALSRLSSVSSAAFLSLTYSLFGVGAGLLNPAITYGGHVRPSRRPGRGSLRHEFLQPAARAVPRRRRHWDCLGWLPARADAVRVFARRPRWLVVHGRLRAVRSRGRPGWHRTASRPAGAARPPPHRYQLRTGAGMWPGTCWSPAIRGRRSPSRNPPGALTVTRGGHVGDRGPHALPY